MDRIAIVVRGGVVDGVWANNAPLGMRTRVKVFDYDNLEAGDGDPEKFEAEIERYPFPMSMGEEEDAE